MKVMSNVFEGGKLQLLELHKYNVSDVGRNETVIILFIFYNKGLVRCPDRSGRLSELLCRINQSRPGQPIIWGCCCSTLSANSKMRKSWRDKKSVK